MTTNAKPLGHVNIKGRLAFADIFEPKSVNGGAPSYSTSIIIPKGDAQLPAFEQAMKDVAQSKWGDKWQAIYTAMEAGDKLAIHNGDLKAYDGFAGNLFISSRRDPSKGRPTIVDADGKTQLVQADGKPYSGCYAVALLALWAQDNQFGKRINAELRGVQFWKDGDAFSGGAAPADETEFEDLSEGADAAAALV